MPDYIMRSLKGLILIEFPLLAEAGFPCAVSTRSGGVSKAPFASLNLGFHVEDEPGSVLENRRRFFSAWGIEPHRSVHAQQVHGNRVAVVKEEGAGRGAIEYADAFPETDGLMTSAANLPLAVTVADCLPVLLADPKRKAIAALHGGWRSLAASILPRALAALKDGFDSDPKDLLAALGPCIDPCCYRVGEEVREVFSSLGLGKTFRKKEKGGLFLDLRDAALKQLLAAGLRKEHIASCDLCTACRNDLFFSFRRDGPTGRMLAAIRIG